MIGTVRTALIGKAPVVVVVGDGHTYSSEWSPDPSFDIPADWSQTGGSTVSGSVLTIGSSVPRRSSSVPGMTGTPPAGDYLFAWNCTVLPVSGTITVSLGAASVTLNITKTGADSFLATGLSPTTNGLAIIGTGGSSFNGSFDSLSIKQQLT